MIPSVRPLTVFRRALFGLISFALVSGMTAADLRDATVVLSAQATMPERKAAAILVDEVARRTRLTLRIRSTWPETGPVIAVAAGSKPAGFPAEVNDALIAAPDGPEGYRVQHLGRAIVIAGNTPVAALFGVGYLLRHLRLEADPMTNRAVIEAPDDLRVATSPRHGIRGFQFNYRDWSNSYDGWDAPMFEQYVRDMAVFGANAVELMGPGPDNERESPLFPLSKADMLVEMSRITHEYGLQVWLFIPMRSSQTDADALAEWGEVFRRMPYLDAVFVPGGDPGITPPERLLPLLERQTANLHRHHPRAQMWISPQEFSRQWMDTFFAYLQTNPDWLTGVAYGPWIRLPLPEFRARVPARYPVRLYPDVAHSTYCENPVRDWDPALMYTEGREPVNPRPRDMAQVFHAAEPYNVGTLLYSEGINDDVNKVVFSLLDWDPTMDVEEIIREYARYFLGCPFERDGAEGIFGLEDNWRGPLLTNAGVDRTFARFQELERRAPPALLANWRFQQLLYRAYFDEYVKTRLTHETALERQARGVLQHARESGSMAAIKEAARILDEATTRPVGVGLRERLNELAAQLFQSIRAQLSVERYKAKSFDRGATLDTVDMPLNDRPWMERRFAEIGRLAGEPARLAQIDALLNRADPGPGGRYDDLGNPEAQPDLEGELPVAADPGVFHSPHNAPMSGTAQFMAFPQAWRTYEETRWDQPLTLHYRNLDPGARYRVRVVYFGWSRNDSRVRLVANGRIEIHPYYKKPPLFTEREFDLPPEATAGGDLRLQWQPEPGGVWSGAMVSEVLLIRNGRG